MLLKVPENDTGSDGNIERLHGLRYRDRQARVRVSEDRIRQAATFRAEEEQQRGSSAELSQWCPTTWNQRQGLDASR